MPRATKKRSDQYARLHDVYVMADPRSGAIRYVGRTVRGVTFRGDLHAREAKDRSYPVHRWINRLRQSGLRPMVVCAAEGVHHSYETDLCQALVRLGARLLNVTPSAPRMRGPIVVDVERAGDRTAAIDVVHLGIAATHRGASFQIPDAIAAAAMRQMADALDPPRGSRRPSQYVHELAWSFAQRAFVLVVDGRPQEGIYEGNEDGFFPLLDAARALIDRCAKLAPPRDQVATQPNAKTRRKAR